MTILTLFAYLIILIVIAIQSYRKIENYTDFFVARNRGTLLTITGSLVATILGGSAVIGTIDEGSRLGWASGWYMLCAAIGLLGLLPITAQIKKHGQFSMPDLLGSLFGDKLRKLSSYIIPFAWLGIIAVQLIAAGKILQSFIAIDYQLGVIVAGIVFTAYTIAGGQFSVLRTDLIQAIFILASLAILAIYGFAHPIAKNSFSSVLSFPFNSNFNPFDLFILIITYSLTFTAGPDIYSRIFSANSIKTSQKSVLITAAILIPVAFTIAFLAVVGANYNNIDQEGAVLINLSKYILPNWALPLIVVGLLSVVLSSASTTLLSDAIIVTALFEKNNYTNKSIAKTRLVMVIIGILSIVLACNFTSIIGMLLIALTFYSGAFIPPILLGLMGLRVKEKFASIAVLLGGIVALSGKIIYYLGDTKNGNIVIITGFIINTIILVFGKKKPSVQQTA